MNRQLNCMISRSDDTPQLLAEELVLHGFIHYMDSCAIQVQWPLHFNILEILNLKNQKIIGSDWDNVK